MPGPGHPPDDRPARAPCKSLERRHAASGRTMSRDPSGRFAVSARKEDGGRAGRHPGGVLPHPQRERAHARRALSRTRPRVPGGAARGGRTATGRVVAASTDFRTTIDFHHYSAIATSTPSPGNCCQHQPGRLALRREQSGCIPIFAAAASRPSLRGAPGPVPPPGPGRSRGGRDAEGYHRHRDAFPSRPTSRAWCAGRSTTRLSPCRSTALSRVRDDPGYSRIPLAPTTAVRRLAQLRPALTPRPSAAGILFSRGGRMSDRPSWPARPSSPAKMAQRRAHVPGAQSRHRRDPGRDRGLRRGRGAAALESAVEAFPPGRRRRAPSARASCASGATS